MLSHIAPHAIRCGAERFWDYSGHSYSQVTPQLRRANLDIFWLEHESLEDSADLPDPGVLALEIAEDLEAVLQQFATIAEDLKVAPA